MPKYNIFFNDNSILDLGVYAVNRPNVPIPERNIEEKEIKGSDGSLTIDYGTYKNISIDIEFNFIDNKNFYERIRVINKWLNNIIDSNIRFTDNSNYFYKVKYTRCKDIVREYKVKGSFIVSFICDPYQYLECGKDEIEISNNSILNNPSYIDATPIIKLVGNGIVTLYINEQPLVINLGQNITIDCGLKESYRVISGAKEYVNTRLTGKYPILAEGRNAIRYTGNITKVCIIPNWRII